MGMTWQDFREIEQHREANDRWFAGERDHDWQGPRCAECGADEAGSHADAPCPGFEPAQVSP